MALKKSENEHTHRWTVFVRGFNNEDISTYVRKVVLNYMKVSFNPIAVYGGGYEYESDTDIYVYISYISIIILYSPQS